MSVKLWSVSTREVLQTFRLVNVVSAVVFTSDGRFLVAGVKNSPVTAIDTLTGVTTSLSSHVSTGSQAFVWGLACTSHHNPRPALRMHFAD